MINLLRRSALVATPLVGFGYLGSEAGESIDRACKETLNCIQAHTITAEQLATGCGAYVGLIGGCALMAADIFIENRRNRTY